jgi:hypothetical protein
MLNQLIKTLIFILIFSSVINAQLKIAVVNSDPFTNKVIVNKKIGVLHNFGDEILIQINSAQEELLNLKSISYKIIDDNIASSDYFLVHGRKGSSGVSSFDQSIIYEHQDNYVIKDIASISSSSKLELEIVPLKITFSNEYLNSNYFVPTVSTKLDTLIESVNEIIKEDSVRNYIQTLQDFGTRYVYAPNRKIVANWIKNKFLSFGLTDVELDSFMVQGTMQYNVVAKIKAESETDEVIVVGAHHDSITRTTPMNTAPGADDNASGTSAVLEIARAINTSQIELETNIQFVTFAAEEVGLYGSYYHARKLKTENANVRLMINHDMISNSPYSIQSSKMSVNYYSGSEPEADLAVNCGNKYSEVRAVTGSQNSAYSDSYPYFKEGFKVVYFEEYNFSPVYHTDNDIISNINVPFCTEVIKASSATLIASMHIPGMVDNISITDNVGGESINVSWSGVDDKDLSHYNVYVGRSSNNYQRTLQTNQSNIIIDQLENGVEYFIGISAIDTDGFESTIVEQSFVPYAFRLADGILIIDETYDGTGETQKPTDEEVDTFYNSILNEFEKSELDLTNIDELNVSNIGDFSTVIWHGNDLNEIIKLRDAEEVIKRFLDAGGNFIYTGYLPSKAILSNDSYPREFVSGDFIFDYLKIRRVDKKPFTKFIGANSEDSDLLSLEVDTTKVLSTYDYHLSHIEAIYPTEDASIIYKYNSNYDDSKMQSAMKGEPVGIQYLGDDYNLALLSFPLFYINEYQAREVFKTLLHERFNEKIITSIENEAIPTGYSLSQNFPNPFNPSTKIKFGIPESGIVDLRVYNMLGEEVAILVNKELQAGYHEANFGDMNLASGMYIYRIKVGDDFNSVKKMLLLK